MGYAIMGKNGKIKVKMIGKGIVCPEKLEDRNLFLERESIEQVESREKWQLILFNGDRMAEKLQIQHNYEKEPKDVQETRTEYLKLSIVFQPGIFIFQRLSLTRELCLNKRFNFGAMTVTF